MRVRAHRFTHDKKENVTNLHYIHSKVCSIEIKIYYQLSFIH